MANLPLAERRECLSSPPPPVTHTHFHSLSAPFYKSARYSFCPWITVNYPLTGPLFDLLYCLSAYFPFCPSGVKRGPAYKKYTLNWKSVKKKKITFLTCILHIHILWLAKLSWYVIMLLSGASWNIFFWSKISCFGNDTPFPLPPCQPSTPKYALLSETTWWVGPDGLSHCLLHLLDDMFFFLGWCLTRLQGERRRSNWMKTAWRNY